MDSQAILSKSANSQAVRNHAARPITRVQLRQDKSSVVIQSGKNVLKYVGSLEIMQSGP